VFVCLVGSVDVLLVLFRSIAKNSGRVLVICQELLRGHFRIGVGHQVLAICLPHAARSDVAGGGVHDLDRALGGTVVTILEQVVRMVLSLGRVDNSEVVIGSILKSLDFPLPDNALLGVKGLFLEKLFHGSIVHVVHFWDDSDVQLWNNDVCLEVCDFLLKLIHYDHFWVGASAS